MRGRGVADSIRADALHPPDIPNTEKKLVAEGAEMSCGVVCPAGSAFAHE